MFALGPTVIGHLTAPLTRLERAAFALSSFLMMAPALVVNAVSDGLSLVALGPIPVTTPLDLGLRAAGLVLFVILSVHDRRTEWAGPEERGDGRTVEETV